MPKLGLSALVVDENSTMKIRHLFSNELRDFAIGQGAGITHAEKMRSWRKAVLMALGLSGLLVAFINLPGFVSTSGHPAFKRTSSPTKSAEVVPLPVCEPMDVSTDPSTIQVENWLVPAGVRTGRVTQDCFGRRSTWQITETLEKGKWVMQRVARIP